jgi:endonuclease/exonuclease/phosphatase family metal-dependent hydrolase
LIAAQLAMRFRPATEYSFAALAVVVGLVTAPAASAEPNTLPLRIVTYNAEQLNAPGSTVSSIAKFRFDFARRRQLEATANLIETLNPDIFNLVEVTSKEAVDDLVEILHEKGMTEYRGYHIDSNDPFTAGDVAVITKLQPDSVDGKLIRTIYSEEGDPTWRENFSFHGRDGSMVTQTTSLSRNSLYFITVGGYKLGFVGLHLKSNPEQEYANSKRSAESKIVRREITGEVVKRGYLPIVIGDLNDYDPDVPDRDDTRNTKTTVLHDLKDYDPDHPGPELVNVAEKIVRQPDRYTEIWDWNENGAVDGQDVFTMLDHILLPQELMPYVKRVFIDHCVSLDVSDHFPVVVDLSLPVKAGSVAGAAN